MALDTRQRNAIQKAVELGDEAKAERVQYGVYRVASASSDKTYLVTVHGAEYVCDCTAGQHGKPCHHTAAVLIAKVERTSGARVIGPAPVAADAPVATPPARRDVRRVELL
ncbi:MAG: SWIM zinc finger family protein [Chloroflexota bacterium]